MTEKGFASLFAAALGMCIVLAGCQNPKACVSASSGAKRLIIAESGKSDFQIVLPDKPSDKNLDKFLSDTAELIKNCVREAAGASLPVVRESAADPKKSGIYLGDTAFARAAGTDVNALPGWVCVGKVSGGNVILAGNDRKASPDVDSYSGYFLGSVRAALIFLERYAGTRFLMPGEVGAETVKMSAVSVPSDLNDKIPAPVFHYCTGPGFGMFYDIANNYLRAAGLKLYGGHSYYTAVPKDRYGKDHPEYFALLGGARVSSENHLCISNSGVQDLIYAEMLKQLDMGYETVEVNPTDGYRPCECENCVKLFGVDDPGEKLWLLHRKLAERLLKDRPGKKIMLCAYGPTIEPPKTFKSFPDNVTIELCGYSPEYFDKWKDFKVACGYSVYSYNWGTYHVIGVTPKRSPKFCSDQIKLFKDKNIHGIYRCGFGEFPGMEGPAYYVFGKAMGDPDGAGAAPLAEEFYRLAYGEAAAPMRAFFEALNPRLDAYAALENGGALPSNPRVALAMIYSPDVLISMGKNLERAKTLASNPKVKQRVALVEKEFEYVKNLAEIIHLHNAYSLRTNKQNFDQLAAEIDKRNAMINSLYDGNGKMRQFPGWPEINLFRGERKDRLLSNGFLSGKIGAPLNWSTETLRKSGLLPGQGKKSIKIRMAKEPVSMDGNLDAGAWKDAEFNDIGELQMGAVSDKTMFKALYDNENIYMGVSAWLPEPGEYTVRGHDGSCWSQECVEIFIDPFGSREKYFHFIYNPVDNSCYEESFGFITDPLDIRYGKPDVSWNGKWEYKNSLGSGKWNSVVKIPFSSLGVKKPEKGAVWCVNIGREHYRTGKPTEYSLWSPNFETINFCDSGAFGEIAFEP